MLKGLTSYINLCCDFYDVAQQMGEPKGCRVIIFQADRDRQLFSLLMMRPNSTRASHVINRLSW